MQDAIIAETGNSRFLRTVAGIKQLCPTYDDFLALLVKGELPIDWAGKNADGWVQQGTELNKANLLTDATAALLDLPAAATPNDMLAALANRVKTAETTASAANTTANSALTKAGKIITYGTSALTSGSSNLTTGYIYVQYE